MTDRTVAEAPRRDALTRRAWGWQLAGLVAASVGLAGDRVRAAAGAPQAPDSALGSPRRVVPVRAVLDHPQGLEVSADGATWWVSSVHRTRQAGLLAECEAATGTVRRLVEVHLGSAYHPGGLSRAGGHLWVPVAEYRRESRTIIQQRDIATLSLVHRVEVADHIGCLAASEAHLIGANWDARTIYAWDYTGREIERRPNPTAARYQDMKWVGGRLVAGGLLDAGGVIDVLSWPSLRLEHRVVVGRTDRGTILTHEGLAVSETALLLVPEDDPARVFVFPRPDGV